MLDKETSYRMIDFESQARGYDPLFGDSSFKYLIIGMELHKQDPKLYDTWLEENMERSDEYRIDMGLIAVLAKSLSDSGNGNFDFSEMDENELNTYRDMMYRAVRGDAEVLAQIEKEMNERGES